MTVFLLLAAAALPLALAIAALIVALSASSRVRGGPTPLERRLDSLDDRLRRLETTARRPQPETHEPAPAAQAALPVAPAPAVAAAPRPAPTSVPPPIPARVAAPAAPAASPIPEASLEERIGGRWATWVGVLTIVIAMGFLLRLAIERNMIGPHGRVVLGAIAGAGMIAGAWVLREKRALPLLSMGLAGGGLAILYLTTYAAYDFYHFIEATAAYAAMLAVTSLGAAFAGTTRQQPTAVLAVLGGLLTPVLLHAEGHDERVLLGYLIVLNLLVLALATARTWPALNRLAFVGSVLVFLPVLVAQPASPEPVGRLVLMSALFLVFLLLPLLPSWWTSSPAEPLDLFLVLANGACYFGAVYVTLERAAPRLEGPWAFGLAALYLGLASFHAGCVPKDDVAPVVHAGAAAMFVAVAFPLMLHGPWITLAWAAQGVVLVFVAGRTPHREPALAAATLLFAGAVARAVVLDPYWFHSDVRGWNLTTGVGCATAAVMAWAAGIVGSRGEAKGGASRGEPFTTLFGLGAAFLLAAILHREVTAPWNVVALTLEMIALAAVAVRWPRPSWEVGAVVLAAVAMVVAFVTNAEMRVSETALFNRWVIARIVAAVGCALAGRGLFAAKRTQDTGSGAAALFSLAWLELLAALSIDWLHHMGATIGLVQRGLEHAPLRDLWWQLQLGLSVLWAVYAAVSLALGFLWSAPPLRYAALGLLGVTVAKVFLVDLSEVEAIWRVLSFLVLGLTLLGVSVLYQRRMK